ncbi:hypothetical protein ACFQX4_22205 [Roseomonas sp. GCM10028921]
MVLLERAHALLVRVLHVPNPIDEADQGSKIENVGQTSQTTPTE